MRRREVRKVKEGSTTVWEAAPQQGMLVLQRPAGPRGSRPQGSHRDCPSSPSVCTPEQPGVDKVPCKTNKTRKNTAIKFGGCIPYKKYLIQDRNVHTSIKYKEKQL